MNETHEVYTKKCDQLILDNQWISVIFENDVKSDTGLYLDTSHLSPFLCSGFIMAYFNLSGNTPRKSILLHM